MVFVCVIAAVLPGCMTTTALRPTPSSDMTAALVPRPSSDTRTPPAPAVRPSPKANGLITTIAGNGMKGQASTGVFTGDGGLAINAPIGPTTVYVDSDGVLYIADGENHRIRKVDQSGQISTVAGNGKQLPRDLKGIATQVALIAPDAMTKDTLGNLCFADAGLIFRLDHSGYLTTIAGGGNKEIVDGAKATEIGIRVPWGITIGPDKCLYFAESQGTRVCRINADSTVSIVAGTRDADYNNHLPAFRENFWTPSGVAFDSKGNLYVCDQDHHQVRKIDRSGAMTVVAGNGVSGSSNPFNGGFSGDGGPAVAAQLFWPQNLAIDGWDNLYITDIQNRRIRRVDSSGIITTIAGSGPTYLDDPGGKLAGFSGDGGPAAQATLNDPGGICVDAKGNLYIADARNRRVRKVTLEGEVSK